MSTERRQAHRYASPPERAEALLKVGDETIRAHLLDESATGFALQVDRHPGVYENEVVWLLASGCWTKARIARIEVGDNGVSLGLSRVTEPRERPEPEPKRPRFWRMPKDNRVYVIIALAVLLTLSLVPLLQDGYSGTDLPDADVEAAKNLGTAQGLHVWLRDMGPAVFVAPETAGVLRLSTRQMDLIKTIAARSDQAVELAKETGASVDEIRHMRTQAQHEARQVLHSHQQAKWDELIRLLERQDPDR